VARIVHFSLQAVRRIAHRYQYGQPLTRGLAPRNSAISTYCRRYDETVELSD
jgi:hypothetical protein